MKTVANVMPSAVDENIVLYQSIRVVRACACPLGGAEMSGPAPFSAIFAFRMEAF
jgi:hypothetical protein